MIPKEEEKFDAKAEGATHRFKTYGKAKLSGKALEMLIAQGDFKTVLLFHSHVMHTMNCEDLVGTRSSVASLEGDFHTQINLGNQHSKIFNNEKGKGDVGTYQGLRLAVNRCNVKPQWKNAFAPNEQFLQDLRGVHSSGFAMAELGMEKLSDHPTKNPPPANKKEGKCGLISCVGGSCSNILAGITIGLRSQSHNQIALRRRIGRSSYSGIIASVAAAGVLTSDMVNPCSSISKSVNLKARTSDRRAGMKWCVRTVNITIMSKPGTLRCFMRLSTTTSSMVTAFALLIATKRL